jgi:hypothetical protein
MGYSILISRKLEEFLASQTRIGTKMLSGFQGFREYVFVGADTPAFGTHSQPA